MRISKTIIENFKGIKKITTTLKNGVFYICGKNESGKSSFLDGLMFNLKGKKAFAPGKWKEITSTTDGKTMTVCTLVDDNDNEVLKITRKIGKSGNETAVIEDPSGKKFTQKDLDGLIEAVSLNPKAFMEMNSKDQAVFIGIDTGEIDAQYKAVFQERTDVGRDKKRLAGAMEESYCEEPVGGDVDIDKLYQELHNADMTNNEIDQAKIKVEEHEDTIAELEARLAKLKNNVEVYRKQADSERIDTSAITKKIETAKASQGLVQQHKMYLRSKEEHDKAEKEYNDLTEKLEEIKQQKTEKIKATKLPFKALSTDEDGNLVIKQNGKFMPFNDGFFSTGRMWEIAIKVLATAKPELKTVIVKDATLLDADKLKSIAETAEKKGLQVLMEYVGEVEGENSITLVEGAIDEK